MKSNIETLKTILSFDDGPLLIMGTVRNKDGAEKNKNFVKNACYTWEQVENIIELYKHIDKIRFYISFNNRNKVKAYTDFIHALVDGQREMFTQGNLPFGINGKWFSCLAKAKMKSSRNLFMLDLDESYKYNEVINIMQDLKIHVVLDMPSKNGYHIFFKPCDTREFVDRLIKVDVHPDIKKDDLTLVAYKS